MPPAFGARPDFLLEARKARPEEPLFRRKLEDLEDKPGDLKFVTVIPVVINEYLAERVTPIQTGGFSLVFVVF
jgi:hypothetical protein